MEIKVGNEEKGERVKWEIEVGDDE